MRLMIARVMASDNGKQDDGVMVVVLQVTTNDFFWRAYSDSYVELTVNLIMCLFSVTSLFPPNKTLHTKMAGGGACPQLAE